MECHHKSVLKISVLLKSNSNGCNQLEPKNSLKTCTFIVHSHSKATKTSLGVVKGISSSTETIELTYSLEFQKTFEDVSESLNIKCLYVSIAQQTPAFLQLQFTHESILIIEPDWLISVTDIVQCVVDNEINTNLGYFEVMVPISLSLPMIVGSLANTIFDDLLLDSSKEFSVIFEQFLRSKPLIPALLQLSKSEDNNQSQLDMVFYKGLELYHSLTNKIPFLPNDAICLEPQFVSRDYSIVGRLDYMNVHSGVPIIEVVELKSSKAPNFNGNFFFRSIRYPSTMWSSHFIQVVCYQLLLESVYPDKGIRHSILYASEVENFLRSVPITTMYKRVCLEVRNKIVVSKLQIISKKFSFHSALLQNELGVLPSYSVAEYTAVQSQYASSSHLLLLYFRSMVYFLEQESAVSTFVIGNGRIEEKISQLFFFQSECEKRQSLYFFDLLKLQNWQSGAIEFEVLSERETSFRVGDSVLVYPQGIRPESMPLLKATIKTISKTHIRLQQFFTSSNYLFSEYHQSLWCIEIDSTQRSVSVMYTKLLSNILYCSREKQSILLGQSQPKKNSQSTFRISPDGKTTSQIEAIEGAINSNNYFLIQGPPGTGKTSVVLAEIVTSIIENTTEAILIIAYTNKVVDELCSLVVRLGFGDLMVRLGSTTNTEITPFILSNLVSSVEVKQISSFLAKKRICISTVASIASNPEVLLFWKFQTAIFDEAAQIVEAYCIGIASFCERCIFIGDEKQLPAIVVQPKDSTVVSSKDLHSISLQDLSESLFSRLLHNAKQNNWTNCFSLLKEQGRMHVDIQQLANTLYYRQQLTPLRTSQTTKQQHFGNSTLLKKYFQLSRAIFCDVQSHNSSIEEEILKIVDTMIEQFTMYSPSLRIGVITPFRKFNQTILQHFASKNVELIDVDTVERFQGSERDVIFYCVPITSVEQWNTMQSITIVDGMEIDRKLNVAITRAKEYFVLCGSATLFQYSEQYSRLIDLLPKVQWQ